MNSNTAAQPPQEGIAPSRFGIRTKILVLAAFLVVTFGAVFTTAETSDQVGDTLATVVESVSPFEAQTASAHTSYITGIGLNVTWYHGHGGVKYSYGEGYLWHTDKPPLAGHAYQMSSWNEEIQDLRYVAAKARIWDDAPDYSTYTSGWDIQTSAAVVIFYAGDGSGGNYSKGEAWWQAWRWDDSYWEPVQAYCLRQPWNYNYFGFC